MLKSGLSAFNTGMRRVSKTHRDGFMDDLPSLPPFYLHFVKCLVVLRISGFRMNRETDFHSDKYLRSYLVPTIGMLKEVNHRVRMRKH